MTNQELIDYIKQQSQQGKNKEEIRKELLAVSWEEKDIEEAFNMTGLARLPESAASSPSAQGEVSAPSKLPIVENLLKRAFSAYKARLGTFVGLMIISFVLGLFAYFLSNIVPGLVGVLFSFVVRIVSVFFNFWLSASLIFAIKDREEKIGITESLRRGWQKIISFAWVSILAGFITTGGYILFIIPGIIFSIWFAFSTYVLVSEDLRGMNALFRSKQLVAGNWWKVLWRFFILGAVFLAILIPFILLFIIMSAIFTGPLALARFGILAIGPLLMFLLIVLFFPPFIAVFSFLLYEDLKRQKSQVVFQPPKKGTKIKFILIGIVGFLLVLIIPIVSSLVVFFSLREAKGRAQDARIAANMSMIQSAAEMIHYKDNSYGKVSCDNPELFSLCSDIKNFTGKELIFHSSQDSYCVYTELLSGKYYCLDSTLKRTETAIFPGSPGYCDGITFKCPEKR